MTMATLGVLSGIGAIISGGFVVRSSYRQWEELSEDPDANSWDKTWTIFKGFLGLAEIGTGVASIGAIAYEVKHRSNVRLIEKMNETRKPLGEEFERDLETFQSEHPEIPTDYFALFDHPEVRALVNKHSGIADTEKLMALSQALYSNVGFFQNIHKALAAFQTAQLAGSLFKEIREPNLELDFKLRVTRTVLRSGTAIYISLARTRCDTNLNIGHNEDCIVKGMQFLLRSEENVQEVIRVREGNGERIIKDVIYIPYKIPKSVDSPEFQYVPIPEKYGKRAPFCDNVCPISNEPIARALFIIQNDFPHIYDKKSLVEFANFQRSSGNSLKNPYTNTPCRYSDVYECWEWNNNCDLTVRRFQEGEIEKLKQQIKSN